MGTMSIMGRTGDTKVTWDSEIPAEVEAAREAFKTYMDKGFMAYRVKGLIAEETRGRKGEQILDFDPEDETIIFVPPIAGG